MGSSDKIVRQCTRCSGCGLNCTVDQTEDRVLIKFHNLIDHPLDIMFWSSTNSLCHHTVICRKLRAAKTNVQQVKLMGMCYLQECYIDPAPTITIISHIRSIIRDEEHNAISQVIKSSEISTEGLVNALELKAKDEAFAGFREYVDGTCLQALSSIYSTFLGFTTLIISQIQLTTISCTTSEQDADYLTKPLVYNIFIANRLRVQGW